MVVVVGVDVGSVRRRGGFTWVDLSDADVVLDEGSDDLRQLALSIHGRLVAGDQVAIAWESPLSVPVPDVGGDRWADLGRGRRGEGNRPWSAGAGAGVLATGLAQLAWLCGALAHHFPTLQATTQAEAFRRHHAQVLLAEALVSADGKPESVRGHQDKADAMAAAKRLLEMMLSDAPESDVTCMPHGAMNLAAAAALHAGLGIDVGELCRDVLVAKVKPI